MYYLQISHVCTILSSRQQCAIVHLSPCHCYYMFFLIFLMVDTVTEEWNFKADLTYFYLMTKDARQVINLLGIMWIVWELHVQFIGLLLDWDICILEFLYRFIYYPIRSIDEMCFTFLSVISNILIWCCHLLVEYSQWS